jgi:hypothetical protein
MRWNGVHVRIIRTLPAISAVVVILLLGCRVAAQEQPAVEPVDGAALVRVLDRGGLCPDGRECTVQTDVLANGLVIRQLSVGGATTYQVDTDHIEQLLALITEADFTGLRGQPFSGTCPTASDGTERLYTFTTVAGAETLAGCQIEIDHTAPLVALVDEIVAVASPGTSATVSPASSAGVGYLEGRASIGPLRPVERVGVPPPTPSPATCTARGLVVYADSGAGVVRVSFAPDCTYRLELPPGNYRVELDRRGIDISKNLPQNVTITNGQVTRLDVSIDTGIR